MKKKILIISQNFYPEIGSAANRMKNIYRHLNCKYEVTILTTEPSYPNKNIYENSYFWDDESLNSENKDIKRVSVNKKRYANSIVNRLFYYLEMTLRMLFFIMRDKNNYDIIFVTSPPMFIALVGLVAKYRYKAKMVLDIRDIWPESLKGVGVFNYRVVLFIFGKIERVLYKKSSLVIVNSKGFIHYINKKCSIPLTKLLYLPNGVKSDEVNMEIEPKVNQVIYAGNIGLAQDVNLIMGVAKKLNEYNISLDIIGFGMKRTEIMDYVKKEGLSNVHFIDLKTREDCLKLTSTYQVGLVTLNNNSVFEKVLPGKIIDYMTCLVPIVAAVSGNAGKEITENNVGFICNDRDPTKITNLIREIINDQGIQAKFQQNCKKYVNKNFLWEKNIIQLINKMDNLTVRRKHKFISKVEESL